MPATAVACPVGTSWMAKAACRGDTHIFFAPPGERAEAREVREARARAICHTCPVMSPCQTWAREHREYGFWGGESEEERSAAGFRVELPVGHIARYPRGEGKPVQPVSTAWTCRPGTIQARTGSLPERPARWPPSSPPPCAAPSTSGWSPSGSPPAD